MNKMAKITLCMATVISMGSLAACQSTMPPQDPNAPKMMDGPAGKHWMKHYKLTPEQRADMQQRRAERKAEFEQIQKACTGQAVGQTIQVKMGDKTIDGTCELRFKPSKMNDRMAPPPAPAA